MTDRPYRIPVLLGTVRREARSAPVARLVTSRLAQAAETDTQLIDLADLRLPADDEGPRIKEPAFASLIDQADGLVIVAPEYNHGYPASLKHALDTNYKEYVHKPVGLVGVSTGVLGGARMIENLLPVLRAVGLVTIQRDVTIGNVASAFDENGSLQDEVALGRLDGMLSELLWMAAALREGRQSISLEPGGPPTAEQCPTCAAALNHHASFADEQNGGIVTPVFACPLCGGSR